MAETLNQQIADALIERQLRAGRVETTLRREVWAALAVLEADILALLKVADPTDFALLRRRRQAVDDLMADVAALLALRYTRLAGMMNTAVVRLAVNEVTSVQRIVNDGTQEEILKETPPEAETRHRVEEGLIPTATKPTDLSATGTEWWTRQQRSMQQRLGDQLNVSVSLGEQLAAMVIRIKGTADVGFQDGLMERARQDAARLGRTQMTQAIGEARALVAEHNAQAGLQLMHTSILDSHISTVCLGRHGLRYTASAPHASIGHSIPYLTGPPYHVSCRSSMTLLVEGGGPVANENVTAWLRRRDTAFQDELLGPTRARMFRAGRLTPRDLLEAATGRPLTLEELGA